MKRFVLLSGMVLAGVVGAAGRNLAQERSADEPPALEPGFRYEQRVEYREVEHRVCKMVPDKRTRWVYSTKPDYFCVPPCPLLGHGKGCAPCDGCQDCKGPYYRPQLLKKQIEFECGKKCIVEVVKQKVPFLVWRKVPLAPSGSETAPAPEKLPPPKKALPSSATAGDQPIQIDVK